MSMRLWSWLWSSSLAEFCLPIQNHYSLRNGACEYYLMDLVIANERLLNTPVSTDGVFYWKSCDLSGWPWTRSWKTCHWWILGLWGVHHPQLFMAKPPADSSLLFGVLDNTGRIKELKNDITPAVFAWNWSVLMTSIGLQTDRRLL